jgi:hypothetical protein
MFQARQINLLLGAGRDYQAGLISLDRLIYVIEGIVAVLDDDALYDLLDGERSALELVYADMCNEGRPIDEAERPVVDRAVTDVIAKAEMYLAKLAQEGASEEED